MATEQKVTKQLKATITNNKQCPHGNQSCQSLLKIKMKHRNVCYVCGLQNEIATEQKLRSQEWFGQFGKIIKITLHKTAKSIKTMCTAAHITYDNDTSALNALNFCNKFIFNDGRRLKARFGIQSYCKRFITNQACVTEICAYRHSWCDPDQDIMSEQAIINFEGILFPLITICVQITLNTP